MAIRSTIGQRSLAVSATDSRLGRALTGPSGELSAPAGVRAPSTRPPLRRPAMARALIVAVVASALLVAAVFAAPVVSRLLAGDGGSPSPPALATPEGSVQSGHSSPSPAAQTYVVRAGDTLRSIAVSVYGNEARWRAIYRANSAAIRDPDVLVVGTTLTIP